MRRLVAQRGDDENTRRERAILPPLDEQEFQQVAKTAVLSFIAVFGITRALTNYLAGHLSDRFGRRHELVAGSALATGYVAARHGLRPEPFHLGVAFVAVGLLLSVLLARETAHHVAHESRLHGEHLPQGRPTQREIFWRTSLGDRHLSSVSQAGLVSNLNDGMAWGLFPLFFVAAGMTLLGVGALLAGLVADALGVPAAMWVVAAVTVASGAVVAVRMNERLRHDGADAPSAHPGSSRPGNRVRAGVSSNHRYGDTVMPPRSPALDPATVAPRTDSGYPEPYRSRVLPREKRQLGKALGLRQFGVNLTTLPPGKESSMRHWHTREDEFVYVLEGELVLRTDGGEQVLRAGCCAGFPAGSGDGHQLVNRSDRPAVYLEVGTSDDTDEVCYPDADLLWNPPGARGQYTRRDGTPY